MSTVMIVLIASLLVVLAGVLLFATARRRDTDKVQGVMSSETARRDRGPVALSEQGEEAPATGREVELAAVAARREAAKPVKVSAPPPVAWVPPDEETLGVTRRQFFNRSIVATFAFGLSGFGAAVLAFLWPNNSGGFGSKINVGKISDIEAKIKDGSGFAYYPEGKMWVTQYPAEALDKAKATYSPPELAGMEAGLIALYQKCPHLGCRVPQCVPSQWFECGCHGSQYNQVGEKKGGPAPRGMDRFAMEVKGSNFIVNTGTIILGPPIGTNTTGQEAEGPHCRGGGH